jgi:hypothetical protein
MEVFLTREGLLLSSHKCLKDGTGGGKAACGFWEARRRFKFLRRKIKPKQIQTGIDRIVRIKRESIAR